MGLQGFIHFSGILNLNSIFVLCVISVGFMLNVCPKRNPFENQAARFVQFMSREISYVFSRLSLT